MWNAFLIILRNLIINKKVKIAFSIIGYFKIVRKYNFPMSENAVLYSLSEEQKLHFFTSINDSRFRKEFPIKNLRNKKLFIIESHLQQIEIGKVIVLQVNHPILFLLMMVVNNQNKIIIDIIKILCNSITKKKKLVKTEIALLILNKIKSLDIFVTISALQGYPIEFNIDKKRRNFQTHVIHYSQQNLHFIEKEDLMQPKDLVAHEIFNENSLGDVHWVWTESYANLLRAVNKNVRVEPVGSITFQFPSAFNIIKKNRIVLFDVGISSNENKFNNFILSKNFFNDIIEASEGRFDIFLKPKRLLRPGHHSEQYINFILELESKRRITVLDPLSNPYDLIKSAKLSISTPFTTIAYIGIETGTNSIFYRPNKQQIMNPLYDGQILVIYGLRELKDYIKKI